MTQQKIVGVPKKNVTPSRKHAQTSSRKRKDDMRTVEEVTEHTAFYFS
jgi:hypothetical protein